MLIDSWEEVVAQTAVSEWGISHCGVGHKNRLDDPAFQPVTDRVTHTHVLGFYPHRLQWQFLTFKTIFFCFLLCFPAFSWHSPS